MRCQRCGVQIIQGYAYCPRCAFEIAHQHGIGPARVRKGNPWRSTLTVLAILCSIAGAAYEGQKFALPLLAKAGRQAVETSLASQTKQLDAALKVGTEPKSPALESSSPPPNDTLLASQGNADEPAVDLAATSQSPVPALAAAPSSSGMPPDVRAWIDHLHRIENERQSMAKSEVSTATSLLGQFQKSESPTSDDGTGADGRVATVNEASTSAAQRWQDIEQRFNSPRPPAECVPLAVAYDRTLKETANMVTAIASAIQSAGSDRSGALNSLLQMQGQSAARVDTPARDADALLQSVFTRYRVQKEFGIASDVTL